jgi:hypothetical protein
MGNLFGKVKLRGLSLSCRMADEPKRASASRHLRKNTRATLIYRISEPPSAADLRPSVALLISK